MESLAKNLQDRVLHDRVLLLRVSPVFCSSRSEAMESLAKNLGLLFRSFFGLVRGLTTTSMSFSSGSEVISFSSGSRKVISFSSGSEVMEVQLFFVLFQGTK